MNFFNNLYKWIISIIKSKEFIIAVVIAFLTIYLALPEFITEQRYTLKVEAYTKALEIVNRYILSQNINDGRENYHGVNCGTLPTQQDENDTYAMLALVSEDPNIPQEYLSNIIGTTTGNPVRMRDHLIDSLRKDLGFTSINLENINDGNSLVIHSSCASATSSSGSFY